MAKRTSFKRVLLLYSEENIDNAEKLRTVLESESSGDVEVVDLVDIETTRNLSLEKELKNCDCIILICSSRTNELIDNEESVVFKAEGGIEVNFDGKIISQILKENRDNVRSKIIPVSFVDLPKLLTTSGKKSHKGHICFAVPQGKVTERMLEGVMLESLIAIIRGK